MLEADAAAQDYMRIRSLTYRLRWETYQYAANGVELTEESNARYVAADAHTEALLMRTVEPANYASRPRDGQLVPAVARCEG